MYEEGEISQEKEKLNKKRKIKPKKDPDFFEVHTCKRCGGAKGLCHCKKNN